MSSTKSSIPVKPCYSHIGGRLGSLLMDHFIGNVWIRKTDPDSRHYFLTPKGEKALIELGIDLTLMPRETIS